MKCGIKCHGAQRLSSKHFIALFVPPFVSPLLGYAYPTRLTDENDKVAIFTPRKKGRIGHISMYRQKHESLFANFQTSPYFKLLGKICGAGYAEADRGKACILGCLAGFSAKANSSELKRFACTSKCTSTWISFWWLLYGCTYSYILIPLFL